MNETLVTLASIVAKVVIMTSIIAIVVSALTLAALIYRGQRKHQNYIQARLAEKKRRDRLDRIRQQEQDKLRENKELDAWLFDISGGGNFNNHMKQVCMEYRQAQNFIKGEDLTDDGVL